MASDQGVHSFSLLKLQKGLNETVLSPHSGPFSQPTLSDNQPTSAVSALSKTLMNLFITVDKYGRMLR